MPKLDISSNLFGAKLEKLESMSPTANNKRFLTNVKNSKNEKSAFSVIQPKPSLGSNMKMSSEEQIDSRSSVVEMDSKVFENVSSISVELEGIPKRPSTHEIKPKRQ